MVEPQNRQFVQVPESVSAPTDCDRQVLETIERLRKLASQLHEFLLSQIDRLECGDRPGVSANEESLLASRMDEFRQERENWEIHRQREVEDLRSEGNLLTEAWQRLEAEERRLLAERESLRRNVTKSQQSMLSSNAELSTPGREAAYSTGVPPETGTNDQEHLAWLQFQQLRREIQKYKPRTK